MIQPWWFLAAGIVAVVLISAILALLRIRHGNKQREPRYARDREEFHRRREWLEADFLTLAGESGRPRGLTWADCEFSDEVSFARDRRSGELKALVAVTIRFEAIEGGEMEDVEAVGNLRAATAVFRHQSGQWTTDGRAIFNLNPTEAIRHFRHELETVD